MKIAVIGSTGGNGRLILHEAIRRGHDVTAFARRADALAVVAGLSNIVEGDGRDRVALERAVADQQAVIMVVRGKGEPDVTAGIARSLTEVMESRGVSRLVASSAYGIVAKRPYVLASLVRRIFKATFADQLAADEIIKASGLDWTLLRATRLTNGSAKHAPRLSTDLFTSGPYSLSRTAYATALLDLAEDHAHSREIVNITG
ncbi:MAG: NAD(P)-dependent oxidoreductase [Solirubrobacteraceae bacterium]